MMEFVAKIVKESLKKFLSNTHVADASSDQQENATPKSMTNLSLRSLWS